MLNGLLFLKLFKLFSKIGKVLCFLKGIQSYTLNECHFSYISLK